MRKTYTDYKLELATILIDAGAKKINFNDDNWCVNFQIDNRQYYCFFDDGIDCHYATGRQFYSPLDWGENKLDELKIRLQHNFDEVTYSKLPSDLFL